MDAQQFDTLARRLGRRSGRRRMLATLGAGLGLAALGWLRPQPAFAMPYCGNCDEICSTCDESWDEELQAHVNTSACYVCGHCNVGNCYECRGPYACGENPHEPRDSY
jgi:hypothetical protein